MGLLHLHRGTGVYWYMERTGMKIAPSTPTLSVAAT
jgi:hypothetical protein